MKLNKNFFAICGIMLIIWSCTKKTEPINQLDTIRKNTNTTEYPTVQMDSMQAINTITKQKVQELFDLSILYVGGNKNTVIDTVIYRQMESYFYKPDSAKFAPLFAELEAKKVKAAKVNHLEVFKRVVNKDTLDYAKFNVEYFDAKEKSLGVVERNAQYILALPNKNSKQFKFYLLNYYQDLPKDSTAVGVTK